MATTITNGNYDTAAAAVPAPYGPLTRDEDVPDMSPNSDRKVQTTSALGVVAFFTYDQVNDLDTIERLLEFVHSGKDVNHPAWDIFRIVQLLYFNMLSYAGPPYSAVELQTSVDILRTIHRMIGQPPNKNLGGGSESEVQANFTVVDADGAGAGLAADVTNLSTGDISMYLWDWGDGDVSLGVSPANHTYGSAGAKTVTLTVAGPGGVDSIVKSVTMA